MSSFLGSLWFAGLAALVGYIGGHVFPIASVAKLFKKD
jgi:hypothetical protein